MEIIKAVKNIQNNKSSKAQTLSLR